MGYTLKAVRKYAAKQRAKGMCSCCKVRKPEREDHKCCDACIARHDGRKWCDEHYQRDKCYAK